MVWPWMVWPECWEVEELWSSVSGAIIACLEIRRIGLVAQYFDFCRAMTLLCEDICVRHPEFLHVRMSHVPVTFAQTRSPVEWGVQARLTPLRFEGGSPVERRKGRLWTVQRVYHKGNEALYILTFLLPRFLNLSFDEKLITIFMSFTTSARTSMGTFGGSVDRVTCIRVVKRVTTVRWRYTRRSTCRWVFPKS